jgi:hypothetical protein
MTTKAAPEIRELFIEELEQVSGGGPVEELVRKIKDGWNTTEACCEEGPDGCCPSPFE